MSNNLSLVVNFSAIDKLTKPYRNVIKTNAQFSKGVIKSASELDKLNKVQRKLGAYKTLEKRLGRSATKADKYRNELRELGSQIKQTERPTKTLTSAFDRKQRQLNQLIKKNKAYTRDLRSSRAELTKFGINTRKAGNEQDRLKTRINGASKALERQVKSQARLQRLKNKAKVGVAVAAGTAVALRSSASSFSNKEDAEADLKTALLNKSGELPAELAKITKQAKLLGNKLPGETADFINVARTLSEQGVSADLISKGGLKSASELAVVLKIVPEEAAKLTAKAKEAFGLAAGELDRMADLTQRAKFAFGLTPDELGEANKYVAPTLNALKLTGIENALKVLAVEGLAAQKGLEGSSFGTSMARFLDGSTSFSSDIHKKARAPELVALKSKGLNFDFFGGDGKFKGIEHAIKLTESWKKSLTDQQFANLIDKMFGQQGKRIAEILASSGTSGFNTAKKALEDQASIQQRIGVQMSTLTAKSESTFGSLSNLAATLFEPISQPLKNALDWTNQMIGKTDEWLSRDNKLGKYSASLLAIAGAAKVSSLGTQAVLGTANLVAPTATLAIITRLKATRIFAWITKLKGAFGFLGRGIGIALRLLPLLIAPTAALAIATAGLAFAVYKNYDKIKLAVTDAIEFIMNKIGVGVEYLKSTKQRWVQGGKDMILGLVDGIKSQAIHLKNTISEMALKPVKRFKSLLGINSPSRVYAQLGGHISEGVAVGVKHKAPSAANSVIQLGKNLPRKLPAYAVAAAISTAPTLAAASSSKANQEVFAPQITININGGDTSQSQSIAAAVRVEIEKAMRDARHKYNTRLYD